MIKLILRGVVIGIANIIPGVSGGTMAVAMGIYDKLIYALTHIFSEFKKSMKLILPILVGAAIALIGVARILGKMFEVIPVQTNFLFIGLIVGGLPFILRKVKGQKASAGNIIAFVLFFALVVGMAVLGEREGGAVALTVTPVSMVKMFFVGVIASATMVIPGVSGSMILMLMGYYTPILENINLFVNAVIAFDMPAILNGVGIFAPLGIGIIIGIFAIAKLIEIVFAKWPLLAYYAIIGLIVASPISIILMSDLSLYNIISILTGLVTFAIGCVIAYKLGGE